MSDQHLPAEPCGCGGTVDYWDFGYGPFRGCNRRDCNGWGEPHHATREHVAAANLRRAAQQQEGETNR